MESDTRAIDSNNSNANEKKANTKLKIRDIRKINQL